MLLTIDEKVRIKMAVYDGWIIDWIIHTKPHISLVYVNGTKQRLGQISKKIRGLTYVCAVAAIGFGDSIELIMDIMFLSFKHCLLFKMHVLISLIPDSLLCNKCVSCGL